MKRTDNIWILALAFLIMVSFVAFSGPPLTDIGVDKAERASRLEKDALQDAYSENNRSDLDGHTTAVTNIHGSGAGTRFLTASETIADSQIPSGVARDVEIPGVGSFSFQDLSAGTVPVASGGTGASTNTDARTNLDVYSKAETDALSYMSFIGIGSYSASYTLELTDRSKIILMNTASTTTSLAQSIIIPPVASVAWTVGTQITVMRYDVGEVPIVGTGSVVIHATTSPATCPWLLMQNSAATLVMTSNDNWAVLGHCKDSLTGY